MSPKGLLIRCLALLLSFTGFSALYASSEFDGIIKRIAGKHRIDARLVKAVVAQESNFRTEVTGKAGEIGLMQIKVEVARDWADYNNKPYPTRRELYKPELNIEIGTWYLVHARNSWKEYKYCYILTLCQYNAGRKTTRNWIPVRKNAPVKIRKESTRIYVNSVLDRYIDYCKGPSLASN